MENSIMAAIECRLNSTLTSDRKKYIVFVQLFTMKNFMKSKIVKILNQEIFSPSNFYCSVGDNPCCGRVFSFFWQMNFEWKFFGIERNARESAKNLFSKVINRACNIIGRRKLRMLTFIRHKKLVK